MKKWLLPIILAIVAGSGVWMAQGLFKPYRGYQGKRILTIRRNERAPEAAEQLVRNGVLAHRLPFLVVYTLGRLRHETLKYGEYLFERPLSAFQVYDKLVRGEVYLHKVVIPEGSDRYDIAQILERDVGLSPQAFLAASAQPGAIRDLDPDAPALEGYLFPDTYFFPRGVSAERVIETMLGQFRQIYRADIRCDLPPGPLSLHRVMILASLIEKETPKPSERPLIAGVFTRRLEKGMLLECDPTVIYAAERAEHKPDPFNGPITKRDLEIASPYNTYIHAGLPPGPICNPGLASIRAALHPAPGKALYFVSNNQGGLVFADTLAQQNRNVARYRWERRAARLSRQRDHLPRRRRREKLSGVKRKRH